MPGDRSDGIAGPDFALAGHGQIKAGPAAPQKALHHVRPAEADAELETRHAGLRHHELGRTDPESLPDVNAVLHETFRREILAERPPGKVHAGKFGAPERVVLRRVDVDGLVGAAVHVEVGLPVAFQVQASNFDRARHGRLEDRRQDGLPMPLDLARKPHVDRYELHLG